jgi:hypothetical protein
MRRLETRELLAAIGNWKVYETGKDGDGKGELQFNGMVYVPTIEEMLAIGLTGDRAQVWTYGYDPELSFRDWFDFAEKRIKNWTHLEDYCLRYQANWDSRRGKGP